MKRALRPQHRNTAKGEARIALFPFLAVLICTMGALVPLLMAITYISKQQARQAVAEKAAEQSADAQTRLEDARWRIEQLQLTRAANEAKLAETRRLLGHLEDHERRLREQIENYKSMLNELERSEQNGGLRSDQIETELQRLRAELDVAARQLDEARREAAARKPTYSVVPYEGPNQTRRRPIYIECRADSIVLQPEGIELVGEDFDGPLGPGNPLAATLRAANEYIQSRPGYDYEAGEPYPMLLVRPEGISAYYVARAAMTSWGADFGYELIGEDWNLAFQQPDPRLAETLRQVVASARVKQARLAAAAPTHRGESSKVVYRASPTGGFVRERVASSDAGTGGYRPTSSRGRRGNGLGDDNNRGGREYANAAGESYGRGSGDAASSAGLAGASGAAYPSNRYADAVAGNEKSLSGNGDAYPTQRSSNVAASGGHGGQPSQADDGGYMTSATADRYAGAKQAGNGKATELPDGYVAGRPPREEDAKTDSPDAVGGQPMLPGLWRPTQDGPSGACNGGPPGGISPGNNPNSGSPSGGAPPGGDSPGCAPSGGASSISIDLTARRGKDWGLRDASRDAIGLRRPISIECHADRLVFIAERGTADARVVSLGPRLETSIDALISAVWERIEAWGIAGQDMYWRPVLKVYVVPGGEERFERLVSLLDGSGIIVERK